MRTICNAAMMRDVAGGDSRCVAVFSGFAVNAFWIFRGGFPWLVAASPLAGLSALIAGWDVPYLVRCPHLTG